MEINSILDGFKKKYGSAVSPIQENLLIVKTGSENFTDIVNGLVKNNFRLAFMFGTDDRDTDKTFGVHAILSPDNEDIWVHVQTALPESKPEYQALTSTIMASVWYEKYMHDMFGIIPSGHPDMRRLVHHENVPNGIFPLRKDFAWNTVMEKADEPYPMAHVEGNGVYEIPVGPIHAGVIEPGHFRFGVVGERIVNLEGKLFFTHKGLEKLMEGKTVTEALPLVERISDDSGASHPLAFVQAVERICGCNVPERADLIRTLFAELERLTMHLHDISNIAGNGTGYTIMAAYGFRIKEKLARLSAELAGNRFWRGMVIPGGVKADLNNAKADLIINTVNDVMSEIEDLLKIGLDSNGLSERMVNTGILSPEAAKAYAAVGIAARATDWAIDTRKDHPYSAYRKLDFKVVTKTGGDVFARFMVRAEEIKQSHKMILDICSSLKSKKGTVISDLNLKAGSALGYAEGWRGEILHYVRLDKNGRIDRIAVRDPSFCNWPLFGEIGPGNIVPDFPICNKSLDLSYSGNDL